jgi:RimJ/RimL family protein N-acetyltransferase
VTLPTALHLRDGRRGIVRVAQPADAEIWIENVGSVAAERVFLMTEQLTRTVEEVRQQFRDAELRQELYLVAEVEGVVVGGADFRRGRHSKNAHVAELGLSVLKAYRRIGLGEALLRAGLQWSRAGGIRKVRLGVFATNEAAIGLYKKLGFVEEGRLKEEVILNGNPVDELLLALRL